MNQKEEWGGGEPPRGDELYHDARISENKKSYFFGF
jgi:hypothetical protein